ncbi:MAG: fibrobacter succinogenes major paralogous domain-containing protein [Bacteroidales bacterium]
MKFFVSLFILMGIGLVMTAGCKKDDDNNPRDETGPVTDSDGNVYNTLKIGSQIWMAENLKTTKYNDGTDIPFVTENDGWANLTSAAYTWYTNSQEDYGNTFGALYNGYAIASGKLCPEGWHVPTDGEWKILTDFIGGEQVAGGKLKEPGTDYWLSPNAEATNETGFTALPGGFRENGSFNFIRRHGYWWTSTEASAYTSWSRELKYDTGEMKRFGRSKKSGLSVRCIKDK